MKGDPKEVMPELEEPAQSEPVTDSSLVDNLIADATNEEAGILNPGMYTIFIIRFTGYFSSSYNEIDKSIKV